MSLALGWPITVGVRTGNANASDTSSHNPESAFSDAVKVFISGDAAKALPLFVHLSEVTDSPNVQLYVGYCHLELGHAREAYQAFSLTAKRSMELGESRYAPTREAAQVELAKLAPLLAVLTISLVKAPKQSVVKLDDEILDPARLGSPIIVDPGQHHIVAESAETKPVAREVILDQGGSKMVTILFEEQGRQEVEPPTATEESVEPPVEATQSHHTVLGIVVGGLGVVGLGTYVVTGLRAKIAYNQLQQDCPTPCSDDAHRSQAKSGKTLQTMANVGLAVGIAGTLAGAALLYWGWSNGDAPKTSVDVASGMVKITYQGRF